MNPPAGPGQPAPQVVQRFITPGYLETMGIALRAGRQMEQREDTPAVIVDEEFVRAFWPGDFDVIGRRIARPGRDPRWMTVVGVARDLRDDGLDRAPGPVIYVPYRELVQNQMSIVVRSGISAESQFHAVREIVSKMDPGVSVFDAHTMQDLVDRSLWLRRAYSWLFALLAGFGLVLSLAGVYGVVSYAVTQRTREIGIRMALGAKPRDLLAQILREGMVHVGLGVTIGLLVAGFATRLLQSLLAGVDSNDPWVYAAAGLLLGSAALAANAIPARRAASVNPVEALRSDG
jgi:putative ABC transport system permease protein